MRKFFSRAIAQAVGRRLSFLCGTPCGICGRHSGTGADLWWRQWYWGRYMVDTVALEQIYGGHSGIGADLW